MNPMQTHVKVLGTIHIVFGVIGVLFGLAGLILFGGIASIVQMDGDADADVAVPVLGAIGGIVLVVALVLGDPYDCRGSRPAVLAVLGAHFDNRPFDTGPGEYPIRDRCRHLWPLGIVQC